VSRFRTVVRVLRANPVLMLGATMFLVLALAVAFGPALAPFPYSTMHPRATFAPPFQAPHFLGTDEFGRDVLSRIIHGARFSLLVAMLSALLAITLGTVFGALAAYFGGWLNVVIMRVTDLMLAFPALLLAIVVVAIAGPGLTNATLAIGIVYAPRVVRIVRSAVLQVLQNEYVTAAVALGARDGRIIALHVLRNTLPTLGTYLSILFAYGLLTEAALSFLGLGVQPPIPSWGGMLRSARSFLELSPMLSVFPGIAIMFAVLTFNLIADGLADVLDPRLRSTT
jgi:peptide/nickel transport system permease protein